MRTRRSTAIARTVAAVAAVGLLVSGGAVVNQWAGDQPAESTPAPAAPAPSGGSAGSPAAPDPRSPSPRPTVGSERVADTPTYRDAALGDQQPTSTPGRAVGLALPSVDVSVDVRPVGVAADRQMALPPRPDVMGWYRYGPPPGAGSGSVVLAGHLDSRRFGLGPLVRLREVAVGDRVRVALADGRTRGYVVRRIDRFDRQALPTELFARTGPERLRVITCGGAYDPEAGGYQENLVLTAVPLR